MRVKMIYLNLKQEGLLKKDQRIYSKTFTIMQKYGSKKEIIKSYKNNRNN